MIRGKKKRRVKTGEPAKTGRGCQDSRRSGKGTEEENDGR